MVAPPPILSAVTAEEPEDDKVLIALPLILIVVEAFEQDRPVTLPPVPVDDKLLMVLLATLRVVAKLAVEPIVIPVILP